MADRRWDILTGSLIVKLGSIVVHAEEYTETRSPFDLAALRGLLRDPEVVAWREAMDAVALLPVKRDAGEAE